MRSKIFDFATIILLFGCVSCSNNASLEEYKEISVIPVPQEMTVAQDCFTLTYNSSIGLDISNEELRGVAEYLNEKIAQATGFQLTRLKGVKWSSFRIQALNIKR